MRKVIVSMMVSVDGFIEGKNDDLNWHVWDDEMGEYMFEFMETVDTFIYGRKSYDLMLKYWPAASGPFADVMNNTPKIILSRKLNEVEWNSRLLKDNVLAEMTNEKQKEGKDMVLFAGSETLKTFIDLDLVDEYRMIFNPVAIGCGTPFFKDLAANVDLKLKWSRAFSCGNVILCYTPEKK